MNKNEQIKSLPLPPGEVGLPFLGEFLSLFNDGNEFARKRHQKYGEIFKTNGTVGKIKPKQSPNSLCKR